jgi:hypothetical protein
LPVNAERGIRHLLINAEYRLMPSARIFGDSMAMPSEASGI